MDLRRVRYFVAVAEELNFRRAAERLYVTQPVVSEHIRKLESELGVRLFDRTSQFVRLTEAGAAFLIDVRGLLARATEIEEAVRRVRDMSVGRLRVGLTPDVLPAALPDGLRALRERHGPGHVQLRVDGCLRLLEDLHHGRADAAILVLPAPVGTFRVMQIATENAAVVASTMQTFPAAPLSWADLAAEPLLVLARDTSPGFYDRVTASFVAAELHADLVDHPATTLEQLLLDVTATGQCAIVPASAGARLAVLGTMLTPVEGGLGARVAVVSRDEPPGPVLATFLEALKAKPELRAAA